MEFTKKESVKKNKIISNLNEQIYEFLNKENQHPNLSRSESEDKEDFLIIISKLEDNLKKKTDELNMFKIENARLQNDLGKLQIREMKVKKSSSFLNNAEKNEISNDSTDRFFPELKDSEISSIREKNNQNFSLNNRIIELEKNIKKYQNENILLKGKIEKLEISYERMNQNYIQKNNTCQSLRSDFDTLQREYAELKKKISEEKLQGKDYKQLKISMIKLKS